MDDSNLDGGLFLGIGSDENISGADNEMTEVQTPSWVGVDARALADELENPVEDDRRVSDRLFATEMDAREEDVQFDRNMQRMFILIITILKQFLVRHCLRVRCNIFGRVILSYHQFLVEATLSMIFSLV